MISLLIKVVSYLLISFHSLSFTDTDNHTVNMSNFEGKKVLIVNIATGSGSVDQLLGLQQLQEQFQDSLAIIAFPSNSFGNEQRSNSEIKDFCTSSYNSTFIIASKSPVSGNGVNAVFNWLANKSQNGEMDAITGGDFQKFLIDKDGMLMGVFSPKIDPMDDALIAAINTNF